MSLQKRGKILFPMQTSLRLVCPRILSKLRCVQSKVVYNSQAPITLILYFIMQPELLHSLTRSQSNAFTEHFYEKLS